jgi:hypothetical protein
MLASLLISYNVTTRYVRDLARYYSPFARADLLRGSHGLGVPSAIFQVALGFAQLPSQFARIPGQRFTPSAKDTMDRSFHRRVPNQMPGYCSLL